jgi:hypothetical protein
MPGNGNFSKRISTGKNRELFLDSKLYIRGAARHYITVEITRLLLN